MMSNKWTFSFLTLMLVGLLIAAPAALANKVTIRIDDANGDGDGDPTDISSADGIQVIGGPDAKIAKIRLDFEEPIVVPENADGLFEVIGGVIPAGTTVAASEGNKRLKIELAEIPNIADTEVTIFLVPGKFTSATTGDADSSGAMLKFKYVGADKGVPMPVMIERLAPASGFTAAKVSGPFDLKITLSETPKEFNAGNLGIKNGSIGAVVDGGTMEPGDLGEREGQASATGRDGKFHVYKVTITPDFKKDKVIVWVSDFEDQALNPTNKYVHNLTIVDTTIITTKKVPDDLTAGTEKIEVSVDLTDVDKATAKPGTSVGIANDTIIPMDGYLVVASDDGSGDNDADKSSSTGIMHPGDAKDDNLAGSGRSARAQLYNVVLGGLRDLETFLINDGTIDLITEDGTGAVISEVMWGTDASLANPEHNQWIEIRNTSGAQIKTKDYKLMFYEANETLPDMTAADSKIADRLSTRNWNIAGTGQSGRSMAATGGDQVQFAGTTDIVSMQRSIDAAGMAKDGTMASSWASSERPSVNFKADALGRVGSPGAMPINYPAPTPEPDSEPTPVDVAMGDDIQITEIMVDTDSGRLPQWIELTSVATGEVSLEGWEMVIDNAIDADVLGGGNAITVSLSGVTLDVSAHEGNLGQGQSALVVAWGAQRSSDNIRADRVVDVGAQLGQTRRYQLLSYNGFRITLVPPQTGAIADFGDIAGNLHEEWELPMDGRSSIIRREMDAAGMMMMGTDANGWVLASATPLITGQPSYYGDDEDQGTPGQDAGGPL
ncbi:hypothetical protein J5I95_00325, partial [Candidatus Poribacteria bacterium]|nr:hypothetical protein [Candidatus Poribacteria bacterium]